MGIAEVDFSRMTRHNHLHHRAIEPTTKVRLGSDFYYRTSYLSSSSCQDSMFPAQFNSTLRPEFTCRSESVELYGSSKVHGFVWSTFGLFRWQESYLFQNQALFRWSYNVRLSFLALFCVPTFLRHLSRFLHPLGHMHCLFKTKTFLPPAMWTQRGQSTFFFFRPPLVIFWHRALAFRIQTHPHLVHIQIREVGDIRWSLYPGIHLCLHSYSWITSLLYKKLSSKTFRIKLVITVLNPFGTHLNIQLRQNVSLGVYRYRHNLVLVLAPIPRYQQECP